MEIQITAASVMAAGNIFSSGDRLRTPRYSYEFLKHLVDDAKAAIWIDGPPEYENKMKKPDYEPVKKNPSTPLSGQDKALQSKTRISRKRKAKS